MVTRVVSEYTCRLMCVFVPPAAGGTAYQGLEPLSTTAMHRSVGKGHTAAHIGQGQMLPMFAYSLHGDPVLTLIKTVAVW